MLQICQEFLRYVGQYASKMIVMNASKIIVRNSSDRSVRNTSNQSVKICLGCLKCVCQERFKSVCQERLNLPGYSHLYNFSIKGEFVCMCVLGRKVFALYRNIVSVERECVCKFMC